MHCSYGRSVKMVRTDGPYDPADCPRVRKVRTDGSCGRSAQTNRAANPHGGSVRNGAHKISMRTVSMDGPCGRSTRTVRANDPNGRSERMVRAGEK